MPIFSVRFHARPALEARSNTGNGDCPFAAHFGTLQAVPGRTLRSLRQSAGISRAPAWRWSLARARASAVTATAVFGPYLRFKPLGGRCLKWVDIFISSMTVTLSAASLFPVLYAGRLASFHVRSSSKSKTAR
ncbi:MAG: hypothetical protein M2R46_02808 [Verrucomicrobia subdivision 3 bacterium]|nr:hypothetical protein [Limisphaerales bacterium]